MRKSFLIIGSGAGGGSIALELVKRNQNVMVLEKGCKSNRLGSFYTGALQFYDLNKFTKLGRKTKGDEVILWRTLMPGGSTVVACANMIESHLEELGKFGINLEKELFEVKNEIHIEKDDISKETEIIRALQEASVKNNTPLLPIDKCINFKKCRRCGDCVLGCRFGAKWSAMKSLHDAVGSGAKVIYNADVIRVIKENSSKNSVEAIVDGKKTKFQADIIILCAGALGSASILHNTGIDNVGKQIWMDTLVNIYGIIPHKFVLPHIAMPLVYSEKTSNGHFLISPFVNRKRLVRFMECGIKGFIAPTQHLVGMMIKTSDDGIGEFKKNGTIIKKLTKDDFLRIERGKTIAYKLLDDIGIPRSKTFVTKVQGSHPGGTLPLGKIVDANLKTELKNVYVCDASILPCSTGIPPIMSIIALAKRLSEHLCNV